MLKFCLVSSNRNKVAMLKRLLGPEFEIDVIKYEYPEIQHDDPCEIAKSAAKMLAERLKKPVMVEDSGLYVDALKGFPGPWTKYSHHTIGNDGMVKLMKGVKNRKAQYKSAIGVCVPGKKPLCFLGVENGTVAQKVRGRKGWGQDPIFIPKGEKRTYGEIGHVKGYLPFRENAVRAMKLYFSRRK